MLFQLLDSITVHTPANATGINANEAPRYDPEVKVDHLDALEPFFNCVRIDYRTIIVIRATSMSQFEDRAAIDTSCYRNTGTRAGSVSWLPQSVLCV